jgi:hypothetical protein
MKGILIWILAGALLGIVAASFIVPPMLSWYNEAGYLSKSEQPAAWYFRKWSATDLAADPRAGHRKRDRRRRVLVLGLMAGSGRRRRAAAAGPVGS